MHACFDCRKKCVAAFDVQAEQKRPKSVEGWEKLLASAQLHPRRLEDGIKAIGVAVGGCPPSAPGIPVSCHWRPVPAPIARRRSKLAAARKGPSHAGPGECGFRGARHPPPARLLAAQAGTPPLGCDKCPQRYESEIRAKV